MAAPPDGALRAEVEAAVLAAVERVGPDGLSKSDIVKPFLGRGAARSTLFRWVDAVLASGKPGQVVTKQVKAAAAARAARTPDPVADVVEEVRALLPVAPRIEDAIGESKTINALAKLHGIILDLDKLIAYAKKEDGSVRNARLLGSSIEGMRRCLETAMKFHAAMRDAAAVDALQNAILDEIGKCDAELAERVYRRIDAIAENWTG